MERNFEFGITGSIDSSFTSAFAMANSKMAKLADAMKNTRYELNELDTKFMAGALSVEKYKIAQQQLNTTLEKQKTTQYKLFAAMNKVMEISDKKSNIRAGMNDAYKNAMTLAVPINEAIKFESVMANVRRVVDFETPQQFEQMGKDILMMSKKIPIAADGLADIVSSGGQAGIAKNELLGYAEAAAKMGVAFDIGAKDAGETMVKWRTAFKMNQAQVNELADKINFLGKTTAASAPKISDVVKNIGPLGPIGGIVSGEIAALGASMVGAGIESEASASGIKNLMQTMVAGESATESQTAAFAQLGFNATDVAQRMQKDAKGAIMDVLSAIKNLDADKKTCVLEELFGGESLSAIETLLVNLDDLEANFNKVADSTKYAGSIQADYEERLKTTKAKMQLAQASLTSTAVTLGSVFLPTIKETAEAVGSVAGHIEAFSNKFPTLTKYVSGLLGGVLAANVGILGMRYAWLSVSLPFQKIMLAYRGYRAWLLTTNGLKLTSAMLTYRQSAAMLISAGITKAVTIAQWAWNAAMTANPLGLFILGLTALIGAGYLIYKNFNAIQSFCQSMWESPTAQIILFAAGPIGWLINAGIGLIANWDIVKAWFTTLWDNPKLALDQFVDGVESRFGSALDWVADKWNWVKSIFSNPVNITLQGDGAAEELPRYASGGRITGKTLAWFAEKSVEYAIPMDGSSRSVGLWAQAGSELGVLGATNNNDNPINLSYSPVVNVTGNANTQSLMTMFQQQKIEFERMLKDLIAQRERVSFV